MKSPLLRTACPPPAGASDADPHLPGCPALPSPGRRREAVPGPGYPHVLGDPPPAAVHPSTGHGGAPDHRREDLEDPQGHHPVANAAGDSTPRIRSPWRSCSPRRPGMSRPHSNGTNSEPRVEEAFCSAECGSQVGGRRVSLDARDALCDPSRRYLPRKAPGLNPLNTRVIEQTMKVLGICASLTKSGRAEAAVQRG